MINCPRCNGDRFEVHFVGAIRLRFDTIVQTGCPSKYYTCVECDYVIASPSDLDLKTATVYVLGNSLSKRRQGMNKIKEETAAWYLWGSTEKAMHMISQAGYLAFSGGGGVPYTDGPWIFTKAAWEKYQADPQFPLAEGQHLTEVKELY